MTSTESSSRSFSLRMSARDLISIGIFAALYFVLSLAASLIGIINPPMMIVSTGLAIIIGAIPFMLFLTRVRHPGMITLFAIISGALYVLTGTLLIGLILMVGLALIAELIVWAGRYRSTTAGILAYTVFSIWFFGPILPLLYARDDYLSMPGLTSAGPEYVAGVDALFTTPVILAVGVGCAVCGLIGGLLGARVLRKHFVRAGLA
ncbi:MptD family putative ECF transporter S component [Leucobacter sp. M11]|uniref:MptD family putative ECF transporter S component n=1 Tax=Leucobacter sp. M11 TaxID=2993565 RepID=UPI002D801A54|nr:MptD family putative ECF transporter S component [Leucobacter sp. M11]MEB4614924.1 MptD family putative ECF transporter S component [Leucobacter sp. M11]